MVIKLVAPGKNSYATNNVKYFLALSFLNILELIGLLTILFWLASNYFVMASGIRTVYFALVIWPLFAFFGLANVFLSRGFERKARLGVNQKYLRYIFVAVSLSVVYWLKANYGFAFLGLAWLCTLTTGMPTAMEIGYRLILLVAFLLSAIIQVLLTKKFLSSSAAAGFKSSEQEHIERVVSKLLESKNLNDANIRATECLKILGISTIKSHQLPLDILPKELMAVNLNHCANEVSALYLTLSEEDN